MTDEDVLAIVRGEPLPPADQLRLWIVDGTSIQATRGWKATCSKHEDGVHRELYFLYQCRTAITHVRFLQSLHARLRDLNSTVTAVTQSLAPLVGTRGRSPTLNKFGLPTYFPPGSFARFMEFIGPFDSRATKRLDATQSVDRAAMVTRLRSLLAELQPVAAVIADEISKDISGATGKPPGIRGNRQHRALSDVRRRLSEHGMKPAEIDRAIGRELEAFSHILDSEGVTKRKHPRSTPKDTRRATRRARAGK